MCPQTPPNVTSSIHCFPSGYIHTHIYSCLLVIGSIKTRFRAWCDSLRCWGSNSLLVERVWRCKNGKSVERKGGEMRRYKRTAGVIWKEIGRERRQSCPEAPGVTSEGLQWESEMKEKRYEERAAIHGMKARRKKISGGMKNKHRPWAKT